MYTKQRSDEYEDYWDIYCPKGICFCMVRHEDDANMLLTHLNRKKET